MKADSHNCGPSSKRARTADFSTVVKRSHSITETSLQDIIMGVKLPKKKVFNDSIHGHIEIPEVAVAIIDTPQFQRLRFIKQVGACHFVYPDATHTRFQHCLGVGHLGYQYTTSLGQRHPEITEKDAVCVMIAGLCHDLGHGPYSHFWEGFVRKANPGLDWHHEDSSIKMFDYMIEENNLRPVLAELGDIDEQDLIFIKEAIAGPLDNATGMPLKIDLNGDDWPYTGRPREKAYLYEIVANKRTGIDVDKWDYLKRDAAHLNIPIRFDLKRFMCYSKILQDGNENRICLRDKEYDLVTTMYEDRGKLHKEGYQHRVTKTVDSMMMDIMMLADKHVKVRGSNGRMFSLSEACTDVVAFEKLTDDIFLRIKNSDDDHPDMIEAIKLCQRIMKRDFYKHFATISCDFITNGNQHPYKGKKPKELEEDLKQFAKEQNNKVNPEDFVVVLAKNTIGMGAQNPMLRVPFHDKEDRVTSVGDFAHYMSPSANFESFFVLYKATDDKEKLHKALEVTKLFMDNNNINGI